MDSSVIRTCSAKTLTSARRVTCAVRERSVSTVPEASTVAASRDSLEIRLQCAHRWRRICVTIRDGVSAERRRCVHLGTRVNVDLARICARRPPAVRELRATLESVFVHLGTPETRRIFAADAYRKDNVTTMRTVRTKRFASSTEKVYESVLMRAVSYSVDQTHFVCRMIIARPAFVRADTLEVRET